jgi:hypothetical protein
VKNEELKGVKAGRNIPRTVKWRKANWIVHILRRNCLPKYVIEWKIEVTGRLGRRRMQVLDVLKRTRRCWNLNEEALDRILWRTRFGRGCGPVIRQTMEWKNVVCCHGVPEKQAASCSRHKAFTVRGVTTNRTTACCNFTLAFTLDLPSDSPSTFTLPTVHSVCLSGRIFIHLIPVTFLSEKFKKGELTALFSYSLRLPLFS